MSTVLLEIVILYFGKHGRFQKNILGCCRCGCQCSWRLGYCKASDSANEQSPFEFYWRGFDNLSNLIIFKAWIRLSYNKPQLIYVVWSLFCILSIDVYSLDECKIKAKQNWEKNVSSSLSILIT